MSREFFEILVVFFFLVFFHVRLVRDCSQSWAGGLVVCAKKRCIGKVERHLQDIGDSLCTNSIKRRDHFLGHQMVRTIHEFVVGCTSKSEV